MMKESELIKRLEAMRFYVTLTEKIYADGFRLFVVDIMPFGEKKVFVNKHEAEELFFKNVYGKGGFSSSKDKVLRKSEIYIYDRIDRAKTAKEIYLEIAKLPIEAKKYMGEEAFNAYHEKIEKEYDESH